MDNSIGNEGKNCQRNAYCTKRFMALALESSGFLGEGLSFFDFKLIVYFMLNLEV